MKYFLAYDIGTSSVKAILVDDLGNILAHAIEEYPLQTPNPGWVEQRPEDYWNAVCLATKTLIENQSIDKNNIAGIVYTTQAMGIIPVDKDGNVLYPNITWVDGRAEEQAAKAMKKFGGRRMFKAIVGIEITGKDVIPKLMWLKEKKPDIFNQTYKVLDVNGYLKYKCTNKMVAEWSGACSYAFDIKKKDWEHLFFKLTGIGSGILPDLVKSTDVVGTLTTKAAQEMHLIEGIPVFGGCDDTQSAAVGTTAIAEGEAHIYTGTSAWVGVSTAKAPKFKNGAVCLQSADPTKNLIVGITESAGANTLWLIDNFYKDAAGNMSEKELFELIENDIKQVPAGADYLIMTPWFLGERCPVSTTTTRATIFNLTHQHTKAHIARAHFEGIAYNLRWTLDNMEKDFKLKIDQVKITGGGTHNNTWMQIIADIIGRKVLTTTQPKNAGALGAAMCAMVGSNTLKDFSEINKIIQVRNTYTPNTANAPIYQELYQMYKNVYANLKQSYTTINSSRFSIK
ncbi:MAG: FGGY-family carbohydrate kinase [Sphingobacteriales bacterium]|jgi:xylulokinase|nr:MAG: FGGY-family carbohydrate kinase [Sphingobacteriales bacterium]